MRLHGIDNAKSIGIFLVILGHAISENTGLGKWIFSFHMPFFFLLSGYLIKPETLTLPISSFCKKIIQRLLPAYMLFGALGFLLWVLILRNFGTDTSSIRESYKPVFAFFYGSGSMNTFPLQPIILWFLPCLFSAKLILYFILKLEYKLITSAALYSFAFMLPKTLALPLELEAALIAQFFLYIGYKLKQTGLANLNYFSSFIIIILFFTIGSITSFYNDPVNMLFAKFGNPFLYTASSLLISFAFILLCFQFPRVSIARKISSETLIIFPLHFIIFIFMQGFMKVVIGQDWSDGNFSLLNLVLSILNLMLSYILAVKIFTPLLNKISIAQ